MTSSETQAAIPSPRATAPTHPRVSGPACPCATSPVHPAAKSPARRRPRQEAFTFRTWGGQRAGAGRKPTVPGRVPHAKRPALASRFPVHVTLKVDETLPSLRTPLLRRTIEMGFRQGREREGFRLVHYAMQRHHLHLIVEAQGAERLSRGIQGLCIRVARRVNAALSRRGRVLADRYFARILRTPRQVKSCLAYVLLNARKHASERGAGFAQQWLDPCSSGLFFDGWRGLKLAAPSGVDPPVAPARTWLLRLGWRRHGLIKMDEVPGIGVEETVAMAYRARSCPTREICYNRSQWRP